MDLEEYAFYNLNNLSLAEKRSLLIDCKEISYRWQASTIDFAVSANKKHFECSFDEILGHLEEDTYVVVINRGKLMGDILADDRIHFEIAFRTMTIPVDYFLSIYVGIERMLKILEKYKLEPKT